MDIVEELQSAAENGITPEAIDDAIAEILELRTLVDEFIEAAGEDSWCQECALEHVGKVVEKAEARSST